VDDKDGKIYDIFFLLVYPTNYVTYYDGGDFAGLG
jgi:hypothetical protein